MATAEGSWRGRRGAEWAARGRRGAGEAADTCGNGAAAAARARRGRALVYRRTWVLLLVECGARHAAGGRGPASPRAALEPARPSPPRRPARRAAWAPQPDRVFPALPQPRGDWFPRQDAALLQPAGSLLLFAQEAAPAKRPGHRFRRGFETLTRPPVHSPWALTLPCSECPQTTCATQLCPLQCISAPWALWKDL